MDKEKLNKAVSTLGLGLLVLSLASCLCAAPVVAWETALKTGPMQIGKYEVITLGTVPGCFGGKLIVTDPEMPVMVGTKLDVTGIVCFSPAFEVITSIN